MIGKSLGFKKMSSITSSVLSLFLCLNFVNGKSVCTEQQLTEAQRAFRNCVESAKAGIVSTHGNEVDEELVCKSLENMLVGCESQVSQLAHCTDSSHVNNLKAIHLSSITDVIKAINHNVDVSQCSVYTEKTVIPVTSASPNEVQRLSQEEPSKVASAASNISNLKVSTAEAASSSTSSLKPGTKMSWLPFWLLSMSLSYCALRD